MNMNVEERQSDSPFVESVMHGYLSGPASTVRPAETHWHMVFVRHSSGVIPLAVGPLLTSAVITWAGSAEVLWIKLKLGSYMPHLPTAKLRDLETPLPEASSNSFWLRSSAWQIPNFENADAFVDRLVREDVLVRDRIVSAALRDPLPEIPSRTLRHRFLHTTGMTQKHIHQYDRAQQAAALLKQGVAILDVAFQLGYFDQPHLTRSLKRFVGMTPAQLLRSHLHATTSA